MLARVGYESQTRSFPDDLAVVVGPKCERKDLGTKEPRTKANKEKRWGKGEKERNTTRGGIGRIVNSVAPASVETDHDGTGKNKWVERPVKW